jgi:phosphohistidine swiveling domain-containing protein
VTGDTWDVMHNPGPSDQHWTTDNVGEAAPGVLTPLAASMWSHVGDKMPRMVAYKMGVFSDRDLAEYPLIARSFYGRLALRVEYVATMGDRVPGADGRDSVRNMFGTVPESMTFEPTRARYPAVAAKLPRVMRTAPGDVRAMSAATDVWWRDRIDALPTMSTAETRIVLAEGYQRFYDNLEIHTLGLMAVVQPLLVALSNLVERAGVGDVGELSGSGGAEMAIVSDIWRASRGELTVEQVVANHGFHGPLEGEVSSRVWREDDAPLRKVIAAYAGKPDTEDPVLRARRAAEALPGRQRAVLAALPAWQRPVARELLRRSARLIPLRGVGKRSFLQALDVCRASARQLGEHLGLDAFQLSLDELTGTMPLDAAELAERRAARRREYQAITIPSRWRGTPEPEAADPDATGAGDTVLTGVGVSAGVAEGVVRVVLDPSFADVEDDEVLVTPTTDPSWASIMFVSSALVVDIGGALSHAAVVARELGIPCVVNTRVGSRTLRTGDRVRVDGSKGTVELLERAGDSVAHDPSGAERIGIPD